MKFILLFILLNSFFFWPRYVMERKTSRFFPIKGLSTGSIGERIKYLINRFNYDIFRLSIDFFLLCVLFFICQNWLSLSLWLFTFFIFYFLIFIYQIYYHIFENIYKIEPLFYRDFLLLKTGAQIFFREFNKINLGISLAVIAFFSLVFLLIKTMLLAVNDLSVNYFLVATVVVLGGLSLYSLFTYNYKAFGKIVFASQLQSLFRNIKYSQKTAQQLKNIDFKKLATHRPYQHLQLKEKPNIYFIAIESYGRILYDNPELFKNYKNYMQDLDSQLSQSGWHSATQLSRAPITGGASWVSYSSALFGFDIKDQGVYLSLLNKPEMHEYEHFMRWLKNKGYTNYRLAPIAGFKDMKIPWDTCSSFYAIDEWIKYKDMNYSGKLYGFGPCPPDQFSLHFAQDHISKKGSSPHFLFFITQNSHSPFTSPKEVVQNWKSLSDNTQKEQESSSIFVQPKLADYAQSINYQLNFISDFILKKGKENDIFMLIGDHQPPTFPRADDGLETPVHIISKNRNFVQSFSEYGFDEGLLSKDIGKNMQHEAIYSLLMNTLMKNYGEEDVDLPPFLAEGLDFFK